MSAETIETPAALPEAKKDVPCNCHADMEARLTKRFIEHAPEATEHQVELQNYGFTLCGNDMRLDGFVPYEATASYPNKKGGFKDKKVKGKLLFNYCPFCGKSTK